MGTNQILVERKQDQEAQNFFVFLNLNHKYPKSDGNNYFCANVLPIFFLLTFHA